MVALLSAICVLVIQILSLTILVNHVSEPAIVLGRYDTDYFLLLVGFGIGVVLWASLIVKSLFAPRRRLEEISKSVAKSVIGRTSTWTMILLLIWAILISGVYYLVNENDVDILMPVSILLTSFYCTVLLIWVTLRYSASPFSAKSATSVWETVTHHSIDIVVRVLFVSIFLLLLIGIEEIWFLKPSQRLNLLLQLGGYHLVAGIWGTIVVYTVSRTTEKLTVSIGQLMARHSQVRTIVPVIWLFLVFMLFMWSASSPTPPIIQDSLLLTFVSSLVGFGHLAGSLDVNLKAPKHQMTLVIGSWLMKGTIFWFFPSLQGTFLTTSFVACLIFFLPGYLILSILRVPHEKSRWTVVVGSFSVGFATVLPLALLLQYLHQPLVTLGRWLWILELVLLVPLFLGLRQDRLYIHGSTAPSERTKKADLLLAVMLLIISAWMMGTSRIPDRRMPGDWYVYSTNINWVATYPGESYQPHTTAAEESNYRLSTNGWISTLAVFTDLFDIETHVLDIYWRFMPGLFIIMSMAVFYALTVELFHRSSIWAASGLASFIFYFGSLSGALDGHHEWEGVLLFYRILEDKVLLSLFMIPVITLFVIKYINEKQTKYLLIISLLGFSGSLLHPLFLPFIGVVCGSCLLLNWLIERSSQSFLSGVLVGAALLPSVILPVVQSQNQGRESEEGIAYSLSEISKETFQDRLEHWGDRLYIISKSRNQYIASPTLIEYPLKSLGILIGLSMITRLKKYSYARYLFSWTITLSVILYVPGILSSIGRIVPPSIVWRFAWLYPTVLTLGLGIDQLIRWIRDQLSSANRRLAPVATSIVLLGGLGILGIPHDIVAGVQVLHITDTELRRYREEIAVAEYLREVASDQEVVLSPIGRVSQANRMIIALAPDTHVLIWRRAADPLLYDQVAAFYDKALFGPEDIRLLKEHEVEYIILVQNVPKARTFEYCEFERVKIFGELILYRINPGTIEVQATLCNLKMRDE